MAFVAAATSVGAAVLGTGAAAGIGSTLLGGALIGAGVGGLYSGITGDGNILNSMLTGGLLGAGGAALGSAMGLGAAGGAGGTAGGAAGATGAGGTVASQAAAPMATAVQTASPAAQAAAANAANLEALAVLEGGPQVGMLGAANTGLPANTVLPASMTFTQPAAQAAATGLTGKEMLGYGLAGSAALSLLGGRKPTSAGSPPEPGMIRPYQYAANPAEATGEYPSPYATTQYDSAGLPVLDTRERKYFAPSFTALEPYKAAAGGLMNAYGGPVERMSAMDQQRGMYPQGMMDKTYYATPTQRPASMEVVRSDYDTPVNPITGLQPVGMADGGDVDEDFNKRIMKNIKGASTKELEQIMKQMDQQEFLRRNMPAYAESMRPSISGMVEGAQYGDRMAQSFGATPRDFNVMPTVVDPQSKTFGGIASIGQQLDPDTRLRMMADIQRTPFDRNALEAVRRVGAGVDRRIGKDASLSAFYEQDPMGRNKMGGARFTQRFNEGGQTRIPGMMGFFARSLQEAGIPSIFDQPGLPAINQMPRVSYDPTNQRYIPSEAQVMDSKFTYNPETQTYQGMASGGQISHLGSYSDGGRLLKGPGDGMSDHIPAMIGKKQPARLADGEFVVPADVVSHLGNGSTDAGAKRLYAMMDKVRKARTGNKKQGKQIKAEKFLPA